MQIKSRKAVLGGLAALGIFALSTTALAHDVWSDWFVLNTGGYYTMSHHAGMTGRIYVGNLGTDYTRVQNRTLTSVWMQAHQFCSDGSEDWSSQGSTSYLSSRSTTLCPSAYNPSWGRGLMGEP
jgi:hypothetical protein